MIEFNKSLKAYNSFGFDQRAERFAVAPNEEVLEELVVLAKNKQWPVFILGGGSNIVLTQDIPGLVIHMGDMSITVENEDALGNQRIRAGAGVVWHDFVLQTLSMGANGLENLSLIPGSVGAAPVQNIGAYGIEVKDRIHKVRALHMPTLRWRDFDAAECEFSYRDSFFKHSPGEYAISGVEFNLGTQCTINADYDSLANALDARHLKTPNARDISDIVIKIRQSRLPDPTLVGNAGSFFHNPIVHLNQVSELEQRFPRIVSFPVNNNSRKLSAAWMIDNAGLKGLSRNGVGVYEKQALVLVNLGSGTGAEVISLASEIQETILQKFNVRLSIEPTVL